MSSLAEAAGEEVVVVDVAASAVGVAEVVALVETGEEVADLEATAVVTVVASAATGEAAAALVVTEEEAVVDSEATGGQAAVSEGETVVVTEEVDLAAARGESLASIHTRWDDTIMRERDHHDASCTLYIPTTGDEGICYDRAGQICIGRRFS